MSGVSGKWCEQLVAGPVWTTLYILCGVSSWLVWTHGGFEKQRLPLTLYGINMLFNLAWNPTFFLFHAMQTAFWDALGTLLLHGKLYIRYNMTFCKGLSLQRGQDTSTHSTRHVSSKPEWEGHV